MPARASRRVRCPRCSRLVDQLVTTYIGQAGHVSRFVGCVFCLSKVQQSERVNER